MSEGTLTFCYKTEVADIVSACRVIDMKTQSGGHRTLQFLGLAVVLWMFVPEVVKNPSNWSAWVMLLLTIAVGTMVVFLPDANNRRFAKSQAASQPNVTATADDEKLELKSEDGLTTYRFDETMAVYEYEDVLAISGGKWKISAIPKKQLESQMLEDLIKLLRLKLDSRYQKVASKR